MKIYTFYFFPNFILSLSRSLIRYFVTISNKSHIKSTLFYWIFYACNFQKIPIPYEILLIGHNRCMSIFYVIISMKISWKMSNTDIFFHFNQTFNYNWICYGKTSMCYGKNARITFISSALTLTMNKVYIISSKRRRQKIQTKIFHKFTWFKL